MFEPLVFISGDTPDVVQSGIAPATTAVCKKDLRFIISWKGITTLDSLKDNTNLQTSRYARRLIVAKANRN